MKVRILVSVLAGLFLLTALAGAGCSVNLGGGSGGPPPHAPAYGNRAKHMYQFYPDVNVYFDPIRKVYFQLSGGSWRMTADLPLGVKVSLGSGVSLELDTDRPYIYNADHRKKFPPGQAKKLGLPGVHPGKKKGK
jgi:hypothetical protein